jgi:hypothetical protein
MIHEVMPIYYVVSEIDRSGYIQFQYEINLVIAIYTCDLSDVGQIYEEKVAPLMCEYSRMIRTHIYRRFPDEMFHVPLLVPIENEPKPFGLRDEEILPQPKNEVEDSTPYHERTWE